MIKRLWALLSQYDLQLAEVISALCGIALSLWLSSAVFTVPDAQSTSWLLEILPRGLLVFLLLAGGALQLAAVMRGDRQERALTAFAAALTWGFIAVGVALNRGTLAAPAVVLCAAMSWAFLRLSWGRGE